MRGHPLPAPPGGPWCPVFKNLCARGARPGGVVGKPTHFGTPEWPTGAPQSLLFPVGVVSSPPENLPFLRRGGTLGRPKVFPFSVGAAHWAARKPSPWGPTPLIKGRWPKARGDRVRCPRRGRMRGQGSDSSVSRRGNFAAISALRAAAGAAVALRNAPAGAVRAATYFAHGGSSSQSPLVSVSA